MFNKEQSSLRQLKAVSMESSPRLYMLLSDRVPENFTLPIKAVLQLKSVLEKKIQVNTNGFRN